MNPTQTKHEIKTCPRCGEELECKVNNVAHCACMTVALSDAAAEHVQERYEDCLCVACLADIQQQFALHAGQSGAA
jgi:hypothetical protein